MKRHSSQLGIWLFAAAAILLTGCHQKKQPTVSPQATAPTVAAPEPAPEPVAIIPPPSTTTNTNGNQTANTNPPASKPKTKPKKHAVAHNHKPVPATNLPGKEANASPPPVLAAPPATIAPAPTPSEKPDKTVVREGGTSETPGAILPGMDQDEANRRRQATEKLLQSTDDALKSINRTLTGDEQAMVAQIRSYMTQSRAATTDGDLLRANNLAVKAHLLSDELVKR